MDTAKKYMRKKYQWVLEKAKADDEAQRKRTSNFYRQSNKFRDGLKEEKKKWIQNNKN
jgi:hypothetical protein